MTKAWPLILVLILAGCKSTSEQKTISPDFSGTFYSDSTLNTEERIRVEKGNDLSLQCRLSHSSGPKGAHDGDSREDFFLQFLKPEEIHEGQVIDIRDTSIIVYVAKRASPGGYRVVLQDNLTGQIEVLEFTESELILKVSIDSKTVTMKCSRGTIP